MAARAHGHKCTRLNAKYYIFTALENIKLAACFLVQKITFSLFLCKTLITFGKRYILAAFVHIFLMDLLLLEFVQFMQHAACFGKSVKS